MKRIYIASVFFISFALFLNPLMMLFMAGQIAYPLLLLSGLVFLYDYIILLTLRKKIIFLGGYKTLTAIIILSALGIYYLYIDSGDINLRFQILPTFIILPIAWLAISIIVKNNNGMRFIRWIAFFYVLTEFIIILMQLSYISIGVGLPLPEGMLAGSHNNQNNLACIILTLYIFINNDGAVLKKKFLIVFNFLSLLIILLTFSRLAIILLILYFIKDFSARDFVNFINKIFKIFMMGLIFFVFLNFYGSNEYFENILYKFLSMEKLFEIGFSTDSSTSSRYQSYIHFLNNIPNLGIGTSEIFNYAYFTSDASFDDVTIYSNPHSLIVEYGYWMGWLGLFSLFNFTYGMFVVPNLKNPKELFFAVTTFFIITTIPSTALAFYGLWICFLLLSAQSYLKFNKLKYGL